MASIRFVWLTLGALALCGAPALAQKKRKALDTPPPIVYVPQVKEPAETIGDWMVQQLSGPLYMASTRNQSGSGLGVICSQTGCFTFFTSSITCEDKAVYPVLINAPAGAFAQNLTCELFEKLYLYEFSDDAPVRDAMSVGGVLGLAFPMASGEFNVSRFSMTGAARAYARAAQLANAPKKTVPTAPRDQRY